MAKRTPATGIKKHGRYYRYNIRRDGKRFWVNLETDDFAEAVRRAAKVRQSPELNPGTGLESEIERFIAYKKRMGEYTEHTARTKKNKLKLLAGFLPNASAATVTTKQLQSWHDSMLNEKLSPTTISGYFMTARAFFRWAIEIEKLRRTNPVLDVKQVKSDGQARESFCEYDLRDALCRNAPDEDLRFVLYCGFHAGLRFQEIVQAVPLWFDIPGRRLILRKTKTMKFKDREERTIPMTEEFRAVIQQYGLRSPFMLKPEVEQGKWIYRYDFRAGFMKYMEGHGWCCNTLHRMEKLEGGACPTCKRPVAHCGWVTPHIMRHTFASLLVSAGESIYKVAVWMGDEVTTVQKHYGHLAPDRGGIEKAFSRRVHDHLLPPDSDDSARSGHSPA